MKLNRTALLLFMVLAWIVRGNAQDVIYSQFYANPIYLNPALAGTKLCQRITMNYRNQWPNIKQGYVSYNVTWDQDFDKISGALGVIVNSDVAGAGIYNKFSVSGIYAYRLQATRNIVLNAALQAGFLQYKLDWDKLQFGDQKNDFFSNTLISSQDIQPPKLSVRKIDFSAGLLGGYKETVYFGVALNHLTRPDIAFYDKNSNRIDFRWTVHSGMMIDLHNGVNRNDAGSISLSPNIVYVQQGNFHQLNAGMYVNMFPMVWGLWVRENFENTDGVIMSLGFQQKRYKIGYSFDLTLSQLSMRSGGAHEISITWMFHKPMSIHRFCEMRDPNF
jgi:type IX secretion system PorP/SprF family membrane protein